MATRQTLQLEELSYEYELFRENQLLTHEQLNKFIRYFEDQDRLTRTCLIGVGLVCGLSARWKDNLLTVSQGCAVTTDGDLLKLETTDYGFFREYANRTRGKGDPIYDPFFPPAENGAQVKLWELMVTNQVETGDPPAGLATFKALSGKDVTDMVALLYLEYYLSEPDDCTSIDCDHLGQLQHAKIKVLLISQQDMDKVINSEPTEIIADHIYKSYYDAYTKYFDLPELKARRLPMTSLNTASLGALTKGYSNILSNGAAELVNAIENLYNTFRFILDPTKYFKITTIKNKLNTTLTASVKPFQVQYQYDFYKDILDCYNEIRDTIYNAIYICCPDKYAFPKHIMLGIVNADLGPRPPRYRHYFYPSPAVSKNKSYLSVAKSMFNRLVDMNSGFTLPAQPSPVRITPSVDPDKQIEWRAIPFYYKNAAALREHWSYYRTMRGTDKNVLSYHGPDYGDNDATRNPLDYDLDKHNFFRIEGHLGKKMKEVMETVQDIRDQKSLPFDVVAVRMDEKLQMDINLEDFSCQFDDLNAVLNAWIVEQDCLYAKTVKFFSSFDKTGNNRLPVKTGGFQIKDQKTYYRAPASYAKTATPQMMTMMMSSDMMKGTANKSFMPNGNTYTYQVDDTVDRNLNLEEDTVGNVFQMVSQNYVMQLGDAYIGLLLQLGDQDAKIKLLTADQRAIAYDIPVKIIARINDVTRFKPFEISDLDSDVLIKYKNAIEALCDEAEASRTRTEAIFAKTSYPKQGYEPQYLSALVELTENCCAADKLEALMDEIEKRKKDILDSLSLARYAAEHNGLEHKAGVHRGGTFVVLYASVVTLLGKSALEIMEDKLVGTKRIAVDKKALQRDISDYYLEDEDTFLVQLVGLKETVDATEAIKGYATANGFNVDAVSGRAKVSSLFKKANSFAAALATEQKEAVSNEMVVADFCLPYLCCSDCPPMVFVVPKQKYSLALPKAVACSDDQPMLFQREPADGTVLASAGFEETVAVKEDGAVFFDPGAVKEADFDKTITFTIDGQVTDCSIKVVKHPVAAGTATVQKEDNALIEVRFDNTSDDATGKLYSYEWNFNDGRPIQKVANRDAVTITYKKNAFGTAKSFKVTLKALNGGCSSTAEITVPLTAIPEKVGLVPEKERACETDGKLGFEVEPVKGTVNCTEVSIAVTLENGKYLFNPASVPAAQRGTALHFTVNGQPVPATITVFNMPDASFAIDTTSIIRKGDLLAFDIVLKNPDANNYTLTMAGKLIGDKLQPDQKGIIRITDLNVAGMSGNVLLTLTASNGKDSPCDASSKENLLNIPKQLVEQKKCPDIVSDEIIMMNSALKALRDIKASDDVLATGSRLADIYKTAIDILPEIDKAQNQAKVLVPIQTMMRSMMLLKAASKEDIEAASGLLFATFLLALDTIRCAGTLSGSSAEQVIGIINMFLDTTTSVNPTFRNLDAKNRMTLFLNDFLNSFVSKHTGVISTVNTLLIRLKGYLK